MIKKQTDKNLVEIAKLATGAVVCIVTLPVQVYLISRDIGDSLKYENRPGTFFYNKGKPTPNTEDFPNKPERLQRTTEFYNLLRRRILPL